MEKYNSVSCVIVSYDLEWPETEKRRGRLLDYTRPGSLSKKKSYIHPLLVPNPLHQKNKIYQFVSTKLIFCDFEKISEMLNRRG